MGLAEYKLQDRASAYDHLKKSLELNSSNAGPYVTLGAIAFDTGKYQEGLDDGLICRQLDPQYGWCYSTIAFGYFYMNKTDLAIANFEKAVELSPDNFAFRDNLKRAREYKVYMTGTK
jgi:tetratricopeptide (TPR) repeat protein